MNTIVELGISESEARSGTLVFVVQVVAVVKPFERLSSHSTYLWQTAVDGLNEGASLT